MKILSDNDRLKMLESPVGRIRAVLDTDTFNEIDDQFAIVQTLLSPERIGLEAIYAAPFHNSRSTSPQHGMELSYAEIFRLLERLEYSANDFVFRGAKDYVGPSKTAQSSDAVDDLIARARTASTQAPLYVIAIAAISNVASALLIAPDIADRIVVVWLGGHALEWPNTKEFNLRQDVGGAQVVLDSGVPLVLVPCQGVTSHLHSTVAEIERYVQPFGAIGDFLAQRFKGYADQHVGWSKEIWDMAPIGWLIDASWTPSALVPTPILTDSITWSVDRSRHAMRYIFKVQRDPILRDFFLKLSNFENRVKSAA